MIFNQGISLTTEQYLKFVKAIPQINAHLKEMGVDISSSAEDGSEEETKPEKRTKAKKETKSNIEMTSDEAED